MIKRRFSLRSTPVTAPSKRSLKPSPLPFHAVYETLTSAFEDTVQRGQDAFSLALKDQEEESLHECRKSSKRIHHGELQNFLLKIKHLTRTLVAKYCYS